MVKSELSYVYANAQADMGECCSRRLWGPISLIGRSN